MRNKAFTLIELLAVIIILGILMLIAIPGVTSYINNSRKNVYVDTAKELIRGASNLLNSGDFDNLDEDVTYYIDSRCIASETGKEAQSPFGKFNPAYVLVVNEDDQYNYYFQSRDDTSVGVKQITNLDSLELSKIVSDVKEEDIDTTVSIGNTSKVAVIDEECNMGETKIASRRVSRDGESMVTLTFDNQGGDGCSSKSQYYGDEWGNLCRPKKEGLKFAGWYTKPNKEGEKITETSKAEKSMKVYAAWTDSYATFDTGMNVNVKMKQLSGQSGSSYSSSNNNIKHFKMSSNEPSEDNKQDYNIVSTSDSGIPIYMWFDTDTIYWWSEDENPYLNQTSSYYFGYLNGLLDIENLDHFDTSKVNNMEDMFHSCSLISNLDLSNFDTSEVTRMKSMFENCSSLLSVNISNFDTSKVTSAYSLFKGCEKIQLINMTNLDTSKFDNFYSMFRNCKNLIELNINGMNTSNAGGMSYMFAECNLLSNIDTSIFDTSKVTDMDSMFYNCNSLESIELSSFNTQKVTSMANMFYGCNSLTTLDMNTFNTSKARYLNGMFENCTSLISITNINFSNTETEFFSTMFTNCISLVNLDLSNFYTPVAKEMQMMFAYCKSLESINVSNFITSNVTSMHGMFLKCSKVSTLDLSNFNTSKVVWMGGNRSKNFLSGYGMFDGCTNLTYVNLSSFDTSNVEYMGRMFADCSSLTTLDLSNFNTMSVTHLNELFSNCTSLTTIYVGESFDISSVTEYWKKYNLFYNCPLLEGGAGTHWESNMAEDVTKAHIDGGASNPGLFTLKV